MDKTGETIDPSKCVRSARVIGILGDGLGLEDIVNSLPSNAPKDSVIVEEGLPRSYVSRDGTQQVTLKDPRGVVRTLEIDTDGRVTFAPPGPDEDSPPKVYECVPLTRYGGVGSVAAQTALQQYQPFRQN